MHIKFQHSVLIVDSSTRNIRTKLIITERECIVNST